MSQIKECGLSEVREKENKEGGFLAANAFGIREDKGVESCLKQGLRSDLVFQSYRDKRSREDNESLLSSCWGRSYKGWLSSFTTYWGRSQGDRVVKGGKRKCCRGIQNTGG